RNRTGVGLVRSAFRRSGLVLPLFVLVFISAMMVGNPARASAQLVDGICRVGIAVDRSGSVAIRDPRNPWRLKEQLKSLFRETNGYNNRLDNPNIYLSFWSFGTAASGYKGDPGGIMYPAGVTEINGIGIDNVDYPYYAFSGELWLNSNSSPRSEEHTSELQSRENLVCR